METVELLFKSSVNKDKLRIEDDGQVAYAYLLRREKIISFVWLYNRLPPSDDFEVRLPSRPVLNPLPFLKEGSLVMHPDPSDFSAIWLKRKKEVQAAIYISGKLHAILSDDSSPGWSVLVQLDGPVARVLEVSRTK